MLDAFAVTVAAEGLRANGSPFLTVTAEIASPGPIQVERDGLKNRLNLPEAAIEAPLHIVLRYQQAMTTLAAHLFAQSKHFASCPTNASASVL